tara:strand:+ start:335 stop:733 length:399 start_codon:yes stop_codon:yes gene_type:complete
VEYEYFYWFIIFWIGWLSSSVWNYIFNLGTTAVMMRNTTYAFCCFMKLTHEAVVEFLEIKYNRMEEYAHVNDIKLMRMQDEQTIKDTQRVLLDLMLRDYPKGFSHLIQFKNWRGMLAYIDENQKEVADAEES